MDIYGTNSEIVYFTEAERRRASGCLPIVAERTEASWLGSELRAQAAAMQVKTATSTSDTFGGQLPRRHVLSLRALDLLLFADKVVGLQSAEITRLAE